MSKVVKVRCFGGDPDKEFVTEYHDNEWGTPSHDDKHLFEMIVLEGAQAGLSWETVLKKRPAYRKAFHQFDPSKVSHMTDGDLEKLLHNSDLIRNRLKIFSARKNAQVFLSIKKEFGTFDKYLWAFVNNHPIINQWSKWADVPTHTDVSDKIAKDLKKRGMSFVGTTIIYAYIQAVGLVNDHLVGCWRHGKK
jgi:DNA-3-methyladenine glycosylase I